MNDKDKLLRRLRLLIELVEQSEVLDWNVEMSASTREGSGEDGHARFEPTGEQYIDLRMRLFKRPREEGER
jgi:hypothetical protein